ncbi:MAG: histidine phosphatase family protein [Lentisphaerales bacterium]|nr:histidine phosphatase family protein [Lentisphaerales bacterium]
MKPKHIILVRHGQSEANVNKGIYIDTPDHLVNLTDMGKQQCAESAELLKEYLHDKNVTVWQSPYNRTRQTADEVIKNSSPKGIRVKEDPRLREQDWGNFYTEDEVAKQNAERRRHSEFFYRLGNGESGADVYDRISTFLETLHRDFKHDDWTDTILLSSHGITLQIFLMRFFHWTYEQCKEETRFSNCGYVVLSLDPETNRYFIDVDKRIP